MTQDNEIPSGDPEDTPTPEAQSPAANPEINFDEIHQRVEEFALNHERQELTNLLHGTDSKQQRDRMLELSYHILTAEGFFLRDLSGQVYYFTRSSHRLMPYDNQEFLDYVCLNLGINPATHEFKLIVAHVQLRARHDAGHRDVHRFACYLPEKTILYLNHQPNKILRITPESVDTVPNGTDDLYFVFDRYAEPFEFEPALGKSAIQLARQILVRGINFMDSILSSSEQEHMFWHTILSIFHLSTSRTKPLIVIIGEPGSGKTTTLRVLGTALMGARFEVHRLSTDERDIIAAISKHPLVVLDNIDRPAESLEDLLATVSTGICFSRRKLYTDNDELEIIPRAQIGITSKSPYFNREDVADRSLVYHVGRIEKAGFRDENAIISEVLEKRSAIMTGLVLAVQQTLVNIRKRRGLFKKTNFRMADAGLLLIRMSDTPLKMKRILDKMRREQTTFVAEGNPLIELLCSWLTEASGRSAKYRTTHELFLELSQFCKEKSIRFPYRSVKSLGMALSNQRRALESRLRVILDDRRTDNLKYYRFELKSVPEK